MNAKCIVSKCIYTCKFTHIRHKIVIHISDFTIIKQKSESPESLQICHATFYQNIVVVLACKHLLLCKALKLCSSTYRLVMTEPVFTS